MKNKQHDALIERLQAICGEKINVEILKEFELDGAAMYIFGFNGGGTAAAIVHEDGTLFHLHDWQGNCPQTPEEIEDFEWVSESGQSAVVLSGLPRLLA